MKRMEISLELNAPMMRERPPVGAMSFFGIQRFFYPGCFSRLGRLHSAQTPKTGRLTDETSSPERALPEELTWD
ncbi:hypothetical protein [Pseudomonas granadensis]|uniref:hypothetical protein n=1 Tax=Pseudomonas granadensis TaxID=1421430 RepID=UPI00300EFAE5